MTDVQVSRSYDSDLYADRKSFPEAERNFPQQQEATSQEDIRWSEVLQEDWTR
jgi:hypothetical protein